MCTGWNTSWSVVLGCSDYNLLGNVHWLEQQAEIDAQAVHYNLLGNVHWLSFNEEQPAQFRFTDIIRKIFN